jgi:hypothetical protein
MSTRGHAPDLLALHALEFNLLFLTHLADSSVRHWRGQPVQKIAMDLHYIAANM